MSCWKVYLRLVRFSAVFTALADVLLGFLLRRGEYRPAIELSLLLIASACLYMAGMVFNDFFDRAADAKTRPDRPLPSGRITPRSAAILGVTLMGLGIAAASMVSLDSLTIAGLLVIAILTYDGIVKATLLGPVAMGVCRFLNVLLGASVGIAGTSVWSPPHTCIAGCIGVYIAGVTWFARRESDGSRLAELMAAMGICDFGLILLGVCIYRWPGTQPVSVLFFLLGVIALTINRRLMAAVFHPSPERVQMAVRIALMSVITLDAAMALTATANGANAFAIVALLIPTALFSRWVSVT